MSVDKFGRKYLENSHSKDFLLDLFQNYVRNEELVKLNSPPPKYFYNQSLVFTGSQIQESNLYLLFNVFTEYVCVFDSMIDEYIVSDNVLIIINGVAHVSVVGMTLKRGDKISFKMVNVDPLLYNPNIPYNFYANLILKCPILNDIIEN